MLPRTLRTPLVLALAGGTLLAGAGVAAAAIAEPIVEPLAAPPSGIAAADVNSDGLQDLAVTEYGGTTRILAGHGNGRFSTASVVPTGVGIALGLINADSSPDLASVSGFVVLGSPSGLFGAPRPIGMGGGSGGIVIGDFNGDGTPDLVGGGGVALGTGDGEFKVVPTAGLGTGDPRQLTVGDFNRDLKQDLAYTYSIGAGVAVQLGNGDGTFGPPVTYPASQPFALAAGDLDGDLDQDLVAANAGSQNSISVLLSDGRGGFVPQPDIPIGGRGIPFSSAVADIDGDGWLDVATSVTNAGFGGLSVRYGDGHGAFPTEDVVDLPSAMPGRLTVGEFTGDARCDIAVAMIQPGGIYTYPGSGAAAPDADACRDRVRNPMGDMGQRMLSRPTGVRAGTAVTARVELSRPAILTASFSRSAHAKAAPRRVVAAGRRAVTLKAPRKPGRYVLTVSAGSLEGKVVRRGLRVIVKPKPPASAPRATVR